MFKGLDLYKKEYLAHGHDQDQMFISVHSHGYVADTLKKLMRLIIHRWNKP